VTIFTAPPGNRLRAAEPGWQESADIIIVGSGIAGLSLALHMRSLGHRVLVVTKGEVSEGSTRWAQGGIAAALSDDDSVAEHLEDTLLAGAGLCDFEAARVLAKGGAAAVRSLVALGTQFDRTESGELALTREGGHLRDRIAHAGGDATGAEIVRALVSAVLADPGIVIYEQALAIDLLLDAHGAAQGLTLHVMGQGQRDGVGAVLAPVVVLATGGFGQVFGSTTNPIVATGDGMAMALRAGAVLSDLEFVQFHPTVMWLGAKASGQQPLVSEAVRGEGAVLVTASGEQFMSDVHPLADLAPRDVVAKAAMRVMLAGGTDHVLLDGRALGVDVWESRFPTILRRSRELGIDPITQPLPVVPAQHYASGGVRTDLFGRSSIRGLFACGEVACTGVHGANRLASNSLLEGLVFADRIAKYLGNGLPPRRAVVSPTGSSYLLHDAIRPKLQLAMSQGAGVLRSAASLSATATDLAMLAEPADTMPRVSAWEDANLLTVAAAVTQHAYLRTETRGSHWREDHPKADNEHWRHHLTTQLRAGDLKTVSTALRAPEWTNWGD
jgi:L-aspartate oxidase